MLSNLLDAAKKKFLDKSDQDFLESQIKRAEDLKQISELMTDPRAESLKAELKLDLTQIIKDLIANRDVNDISRLEAHLTLLNKLRAPKELEALEQWLNKEIYGEDN